MWRRLRLREAKDGTKNIGVGDTAQRRSVFGWRLRVVWDGNVGL